MQSFCGRSGRGGRARRAAGAVAVAAALALHVGTTFAGDATATVRGEVNRPGTYAILPGDRLSTLVEKAGGFTDAASLRGAALTRKASADAQREELRAIVVEIESGTGPADDPRGSTEKERFLAALRNLSPAGRVPVRLAHPRLMKGTAADIPLEDGDVLTVPRDPGTVAVAGAVKSPGTFPVRERAGYRDYVRAAGGYGGDAAPKKTWLLAADGRPVPLTRPFVTWDPVEGRWEFTAFAGDPATPGAGDTIVVPKKAASIAWLKGIPRIDALLVRIAVLAGKVVVP